MRRNSFSTVLTPASVAMVALVLALFAGTAQAQTTMIATANGPNGQHDDWNLPANWNSGIPSGAINAVVPAGFLAEAWNDATPAYTGTLTLGNGATLQMGWGNPQRNNSKNAMGTGGIIMAQDSQVRLRMATTVNLPAITLNGDGSVHLSPSTSAHHRTRDFDGAITGTGIFTIIGNNNNTANMNLANSFSGGLIASADDRWHLRAKVGGSLGTGDVTINPRGDGRSAQLYLDAAGADHIADSATLTLNGKGFNNANEDRITIASGVNETVDKLVIDSIPAPAGTYDNTNSWLSGAGTLIVLNSDSTYTAPTLAPSGFIDEYFAAGPNTGYDNIWQDFTSVNYNLTFTGDIDEATLTAADFENGGAATGFSIGTITKTVTPNLPAGPSEFNVEVLLSSPSAAPLQLQIKSGVDVRDVLNNPLNTSSAIADDTTIAINSGNTPTATITGTAGGPNGGHDTWNNPANWDTPTPGPRVPFGPGDAIVAASVTAQCWNADTPAYTGSLTLSENSTLQIGWTTSYPASLNALGQGGITMMDGSTIILRQNAASGAVVFQEVAVQGAAEIKVGISTARHHQSTNFDGEISGSGELTIDGVNNSTVNLNVTNTVAGLKALSTQNQGWRLEANASDSLGRGDVAIENVVTLQIDAADAMADTATLFLNGAKDGRRDAKLIMNADDTVLGFSVDSASQAPGTYDSSSPAISGNSILTVSGIAVTGSAGTWGLAWSAQPNELSVDKTATDLDPFDMEITVAGGGQIREILETALNEAGEDWADYHFQLGFGLGPDFVPSQPGDGLGFASALSQAFPGLLLSEDELSFDGGTVPVGGTADFAVTIDLPVDDPFVFTLRQFPTTDGEFIPEPSTFVLAALGLLGLGWFGRRRKRRP